MQKIIRWIIFMFLWLMPIRTFAQTPMASPPTCEEQVLLLTQLLQDVSQRRSMVEVENATMKVQIGKAQHTISPQTEKPSTEKNGSLK